MILHSLDYFLSKYIFLSLLKFVYKCKFVNIYYMKESLLIYIYS